MKYLKKFNESNEYPFIQGTFKMNNGLLDVDGDVLLHNKMINNIPVKFGKVNGNFYCSSSDSILSNSLTSLEGCPSYVGGDFQCMHNLLTSLEGAPEIVDGDFLCYSNKLTNLIGSPKYVGGRFDCSHNKLTSLEGCSDIGDVLNITYNKLYDLYDIGNVKTLYSWNNPVHEIYKLLEETNVNIMEFVKYLNEFRPIRGKTILGKRLQECFYMCDLDIDVKNIYFTNYTLLE